MTCAQLSDMAAQVIRSGYHAPQTPALTASNGGRQQPITSAGTMALIPEKRSIVNPSLDDGLGCWRSCGVQGKLVTLQQNTKPGDGENWRTVGLHVILGPRGLSRPVQSRWSYRNPASSGHSRCSSLRANSQEPQTRTNARRKRGSGGPMPNARSSATYAACSNATVPPKPSPSSTSTTLPFAILWQSMFRRLSPTHSSPTRTAR